MSAAASVANCCGESKVADFLDLTPIQILKLEILAEPRAVGLFDEQFFAQPGQKNGSDRKTGQNCSVENPSSQDHDIVGHNSQDDLAML